MQPYDPPALFGDVGSPGATSDEMDLIRRTRFSAWLCEALKAEVKVGGGY